ncbi:hypothetical protein SAMN05428985_101538 [Nocardioides sp. YR527]|nr:hypothetical protein SAMN05428985_101538 [Nocardioides sp. YR527]
MFDFRSPAGLMVIAALVVIALVVVGAIAGNSPS